MFPPLFRLAASLRAFHVKVVELSEGEVTKALRHARVEHLSTDLAAMLTKAEVKHGVMTCTVDEVFADLDS